MKFLTPLTITVLIIVSVILGYGIYQQMSSNRPLPSQQTILPTPTPGPTRSSCAQFPPVQGEITCEQVINIALAKYPGVVFSILPFDKLKTKFGPKNLWQVGVNLTTPIPIADGEEYFNVIKVFIDRVSGEILFAGNTIQ